MMNYIPSSQMFAIGKKKWIPLGEWAECPKVYVSKDGCPFTISASPVEASESGSRTKYDINLSEYETQAEKLVIMMTVGDHYTTYLELFGMR